MEDKALKQRFMAMMALVELIENPATCDALLDSLHSYAKSVDVYELGLPYGDEHKAAMREIIYRWVVRMGPQQGGVVKK